MQRNQKGEAAKGTFHGDTFSKTNYANVVRLNPAIMLNAPRKPMNVYVIAAVE